MYPYRRKYRVDSDLTIPQIEEQLKDPYHPDGYKNSLLEELFRQFDELERTYTDDSHDELPTYEKEFLKEELRKEQKQLLKNPNKLIRHYLGWLRYSTYAESTLKDETFLTLNPKRGNARYVQTVKKRISEIEEQLPTIRFFHEKDRHKLQTSPLLSSTLTYDRKSYTRFEAWERVGKDLNHYVANLRKHFGKESPVKIFRSYESHRDGYPHVHATILVKKQLSAVYMKSTKYDNRGAWRYKDYKTPRTLKNGRPGKSMKQLWTHGHNDVKVISCVEGVFQFPEHENALSLTYNIKYITKDLVSDSSSYKAMIQNAVLWKMKKRSFSFSRNKDGENLFIKSLSEINNDLNIVISNSNPIAENPNKTGKSYNFVAHRNNFSYIVKHSNIPPDKIIHKVDSSLVEMINHHYDEIIQIPVRTLH